ncbi:xanthine dehydrogenase family protein molybdopterin-binding subunit [Streptomyces viridochromogenes]|uniref:Putative 4-hydroxybenzoyl-CoA reductase, alpha subunit n=1 Tax=Streptomyces viridochromogenes Tue57 TaxID=1160705 RepID=L8PBG6_STRVR|nr:xanthine dehydrogenase family protein molybdopterin-binding subunit [Streptomyces viridochromogenes]ELS54936.1 putative 4-hydroxybenzoyl-CoA reductase, alpha subunit [Streptomyces viridochromogenes Tue57]
MSPQPQAAVGAPLSRVDGRLKVTGQAKYAADHPDARTTSRRGTPISDGVVHAVVVDSSVARGRITGIDTRAAVALPGVLGVISHLDKPALVYRDNPGAWLDPFVGERLHVFEDDKVRFFGQPVAVVVARTLEAAQHAADLVKISYDAEKPTTDLSGAPENDPLPPQNYVRGNPEDALASAEVSLEGTYRLARNHHNAMEPHATVARWDGERLTVWDKTQWTLGARDELAAVFGIQAQNVRVISPFVGGAFGNALRTWPHTTIAALAARQFRRPVKLALTREQLYYGVGYRPAYEYRLQLGSTRGGRVTAAVHRIRAETSSYEHFAELGAMGPGQMLYATPHVRQALRTAPLDVNTPTFMRGPGWSSGSFAIESAMDELAHKTGIDPIELRLRNEPQEDPSNGLPFSTRRLRECLLTGAREFGWRRRSRKPRARRDGDWLIGMGMASGVYDTLRMRAEARVRLDADGTALVQASTSDMGPGTYTSMTQLAADALGLTMRAVRFELGDSTFPASPPHGGSQTMAGVGSSVQDGCDKLRQEAIELAVEDERSPLHGVDADDIVVRGGRLHVKGNTARGETYRQLLARNGRTHLETRGVFTPSGDDRYSMYAYSAVFAEVAVDRRLGLVRMRRMLGVYDVGRIISPKLADSQALGAMVGGIGQALLEHTATDHRDGRIVNANLADYLVPVNADIPDLRAIYLDGEDRHADPIGVKGLGEVVKVGVAPAIANAVFNATGRRVRDLPVTAEALL